MGLVTVLHGRNTKIISVVCVKNTRKLQILSIQISLDVSETSMSISNLN